MEGPASVTTENPEPRGKGRACSTKGIPMVAIDVVDNAYSDEQPSPDTWLSEVPPTGLLTGVLGEMSFYYGACWLHHRCSAQRLGEKMR
jgi:hypothetical protein